MEFKVRRSQAGEGAREWSRVSGSEPGIIKFCNAASRGGGTKEQGRILIFVETLVRTPYYLFTEPLFGPAATPYVFRISNLF